LVHLLVVQVGVGCEGIGSGCAPCGEGLRVEFGSSVGFGSQNAGLVLLHVRELRYEAVSEKKAYSALL
jgi:hypothetical protein